jgi:uncharacterized protein YyaL (SSP411 family)
MSDQENMQEDGGVAWREWGAEAFAEAKAQDKPVLLDIGAVWCHWCHVMDEGIEGDPLHTGTYSDPDVRARIEAGFIPIKVDNDRRPDINARYNMGGWPTTAFLTPDGDALYGETYVPPPRMVALLDHIAGLWRNNKEDIAHQVEEMRQQRAAKDAPTPSALDAGTAARVLDSIRLGFDAAHGGFGQTGHFAPKFPHPDALLLVLEEYARTGDADLREIAEKTLHGMADGGMYDQYAGGFFRYSTTRDWSIPHYEKMLEDNARLTSVYALASQVLDDPYYLNVVKSAHGWLLSDIRDPETGAFSGSQDADAEEAYYGEPLPARAVMPTPYIDPTVYTGWNALMVSSLVARYKITGEQEILEAARKAFDFFGPPTTLHEDCGVSLVHCYVSGEAQQVAGLLVDQAPALQAALDLYEATGDHSHRYAAKMIANGIISVLEDENGGFLDSRPYEEAIGELARPKKDLAENAGAALALMRVSRLTDAPQYRIAGERALKLFAGEYAGQGYFAAGYARAVQAALAPGLHVTVVGDRNDARMRGLLQAAWLHIAPDKAVEPLTSEEATKRGLPADAGGLPYATVCIGTVCQAPVTDAQTMRGQMGDA